MANNPYAYKCGGRIVKLAISSGLMALAGLPLAVWTATEAAYGADMFGTQWKVDLDAGKKAWDNNRNEGERLIKQAISEAGSASVAEQMSLHRDYAGLLYDAGDYQEGDGEIQKAIDLVKGAPAANSSEADQLTHAYQDRGWSQHERWLNDKSLPAGDKDQEMSVKVAQQAFGEENNQTTYKLVGLALIHSDLNQLDKSKVEFERAMKDANSYPDCAVAKWFVYALLARAKMMHHDYSGAIDAFLLSVKSPTPNGSASRAWRELRIGISQGQPEYNPELNDVSYMLSKDQFAQLDALADKLRKSQAIEYNGNFVLDDFYAKLAGNEESRTHAGTKQKIFDLKKWLAAYPKSTTARVALANSLMDYAWDARGNGFADSVKDSGWKMFGERLAEAKGVLDADPNIKQHCPCSFSMYGTLQMAQLDTNQFQAAFPKLSDECHRTWPTYRKLDIRACYFYQPRWHGADGQWLQVASRTANRLKGAEGDALYTQMINGAQQYYNDIFSEERGIDWARVKRGCFQIMRDFPNDMRARRLAFDMAKGTHDVEFVKQIFGK